MPREIITLQVGQCGNQIGCRFWDMALREHASCNPDMVFDHALSRRYSPPRELSVGGGNTPIHFLKARAVLIDMEEGVVNQLLKGSLAELFDSKQYITGASGSGNNWAQAHALHGPQFSDAILEKVRGEAESCDSLQTFVMMHSIGGGTGSGIGSYILELLHDAYPEVYRFTQSIFPSADDDVVTSPYNSLLSTIALTEHADCVLPVENQALLDIIRKKEAVGVKTKPNPAAERWSPKVTKPFDEMNSIASNLLLHLTSSMRFEGPLNVDLNEITMNLVPFPRLHFLTSSLSPHSVVSPFGNQQRAINQLFTDVFSRETQLMKVNPLGSTYLACALLMRGNICTISDLQENVSRMKHRLTMAHWNVEGFKVGLCSQPAVHSPCSLLCLANNTCIRSRFIEMKESFKQLYKRKVYVHHYTEYMDVSMFDTAVNMLDDLIEEYETLETAKTPQRLTRLQPVTVQL